MRQMVDVRFNPILVAYSRYQMTSERVEGYAFYFLALGAIRTTKCKYLKIQVIPFQNINIQLKHNVP